MSISLICRKLNYPKTFLLDTVIISVIHGTFGEDGQLQELLDINGFAYAGSGTNASRLCMNKSLSKKTVAASGVPVSDDFCFTDPRSIDLTEICQTLGQDLILKPTDQGSSVALYVISGKEELEEATRNGLGNWMLEKRISVVGDRGFTQRSPIWNC